MKYLRLINGSRIEVNMAECTINSHTDMIEVPWEEFPVEGKTIVTVTTENATYEVLHTYETLSKWQDQAVEHAESLELDNEE